MRNCDEIVTDPEVGTLAQRDRASTPGPGLHLLRAAFAPEFRAHQGQGRPYACGEVEHLERRYQKSPKIAARERHFLVNHTKNELQFKLDVFFCTEFLRLNIKSVTEIVLSNHTSLLRLVPMNWGNILRGTICSPQHGYPPK